MRLCVLCVRNCEEYFVRRGRDPCSVGEQAGAITTGQLISRAKRRLEALGANLTPSERDRYIIGG